MKDSEDKEHRISNLKDMIDNVSANDVEEILEDIEEDAELISYLNEDPEDYKDYSINDEFIYHPDEDDGSAVNLEETPIDEDYLIKTPSEKKIEEDEDYEDDSFDEFSGEISESFDNLINAKVGRTPILAVVSAFLGLLLIAIGAFIFSLRSDRIIDNVVSGENNFISVIFLIFGLLLLIYGMYRIIGFKNPLASLSNRIDSVEDETKEESNEKDEPEEKALPKSNIPLDKESYKVGEFSFKDLKNKLKKPSAPKNQTPTQEELDKIPPAREKPESKKGLTAEEIEEMEYKQAVLENESIDDIFAEVEDIDDIPIISVDSEDDKK